MDEDGYFTIADRVKDMLIVGGYKVFSREVEETLYQHAAVEFVDEIPLTAVGKVDKKSLR